MTSRKSTVPVSNTTKILASQNYSNSFLGSLQPNSPQKLSLDSVLEQVWQKAKIVGRVDKKDTIPYSWFHRWLKKEMPEAIGDFQKSKLKTNRAGRLTKNAVRAYLTSIMKLSENDNLNTETMQESLNVLNGSLIYASDTDSAKSDSEQNFGKGDGFELKARSKSELTSSGASSYASIDKEFNNTPVKPRSKTCVEDETLTNTSATRKISGDNTTLALSPIALEEYQSEQESHISCLSNKVSTLEANNKIEARKMIDMKEQLQDAREQYEDLLDKFKQANHEHQKKYDKLTFTQEVIESEKVQLEIEKTQLEEKLRHKEKEHNAQIVDYDAQITVLYEKLKATTQENMNCNDKINCLTHDKLKLEVVLEEASQEATMSPDSKLSKAVADCKRSNSKYSRLNKTCDDMDWWRMKTDEQVRPLKSVRKPVDFNGHTNIGSSFGAGENLGDFIPTHQVQMEDKSVETDDEVSQDSKLIISSMFQGSLLLNLLFFGFILYVAMFTGAKEFLIETGILTVEYDQEFSKYF